MQHNTRAVCAVWCVHKYMYTYYMERRETECSMYTEYLLGYVRIAHIHTSVCICAWMYEHVDVGCIAASRLRRSSGDDFWGGT